MDTGINIGSHVTEDTATNLSKIIDTVFTSGFTNHMDQDTIKEALNVVIKALKVEHVTISGCVVKGNTVINTDTE